MAISLVGRLQGLMQRMVGNNAGLPAGGFGADPDPIQSAQNMIPLRGVPPTEYANTGTVVRVQGFERHPVVQACVRAIVEIAAAVPLQSYTKREQTAADGTVETKIVVHGSKHPYQRLLDQPSPFLSAQRLRAFLFTHYGVYGNALWFLERPLSSDASKTNANPPESIRIIQPEELSTVWINNHGYPIWYLWRDVLGYSHTSPATDIIHCRDLSVKSLVFGYPRAASALIDIVADQEASQYVRQVVTNHGQPAAWLLAGNETSPKDAVLLEAKIDEKFRARGERGRNLVLGGITDVKSVSFDLNQLEFPDLRRVAREDICAAFAVDPRMIGISSATKDAGMSGVQYREARVRLIQQTIEPMMRAIESELNLWLSPEFGFDSYVRFDPESMQALVEDDIATSTRVQSEVKSKLRTVQEGRRAINLPAEYPEDDDLLIGSGDQIVPVRIAAIDASEPADVAAGAAAPTDTDAPTGKPSKGLVQSDKDLQASAGTDPNNPGNPPKMNDGALSLDKKRSKALAKRSALIVAKQGRILNRSIVLTDAQRVQLWRDVDERATREEAPFKRTALILFGEERATITRTLMLADELATASNATEAEVTEMLRSAQTKLRAMYKPSGPVEGRWRDRFAPLIGGVYGRGMEHISERSKSLHARAKPGAKKGENTGSKKAGHDKNPLTTFHIDDPAAAQAVAARAARLAEHVGKTTGGIVDDAVELGITQGMSIKDVSRLIDKLAFGSDASNRAEMIARTETIGALNQGEYDTAVAEDFIRFKEWLTQGDDRVRESHFAAEADGQVELDAPFSNGLMFPGDPDGDAGDVINCRCSMLYYDSGERGESTIKGAGEVRDE